MATGAATFIAKARSEVERAFWDNGAFSPDRAIELELRVPVQQNYLEQMICEGIVHEASPGHYWLDLKAWREMGRQRLVWTVAVVAVGIAVAGIVALIQLVN